LCDKFLAFLNPFNTAISNNSTSEGNVLIFTYPKTVKKYQIAISKETVSNENFDFGSFFGSLISGITRKFSGLLGGLFANFSGGGTTQSPDLDFEDDFAESTDEPSEDNFENDGFDNNESNGDDDIEITKVSGESDSDSNRFTSPNKGFGSANSFSSADNYESPFDVKGNDDFSSNTPIKINYKSSTKKKDEISYLPPKPTPSYSYELPYIY
jgi:hypothetical protein